MSIDQDREPNGAAQNAEVHQLQERVKELTCLYAISDLLQHQELDLESLAQTFVELIVAAYQYPEVACARLQLSGWSRATHNYAETPWQQTSDVVVEGSAVGLLVVGYLEERPYAGAGPFLPEERALIDQCARQLGRTIEARNLQAALASSEALARSVLMATPDIILTVDRQARIQYVNRVPAGITAASTLGHAVVDFVAPPSREMVRAAIDRVFATGEPGAYEVAARGPYDEPAWYTTRLAPIWRDGAVDQVLLITEDITQRKQDEAQTAAARRNAERYQVVFESSMDAVLLMTPDGEILAANPAACTLFGRSAAELMRLGYGAIVDATDPQLVLALDERARSGHFRSEITCLHADGSKFPSEMAATAFADQDGNRIYSVFLHDITVRKAAETQLSYLATVLSNVPDAVISTDNQLCIRSWNGMAEALYGWSAHEVIGRNLDEVCHTQFLNVTQTEAQALLTANGIWRGEILQRHRDGQAIYVQANVAMLRDAAGAMIGGVTINSDITQRKLAEAALTANERHFRALIENVSDGIVLIDAQRAMIYASPGAAQMLGYTADDFIAPGALAAHPDDLAAIERNWAEVAATPSKALNQTYRFRHRDGSWRWLEATTTNLLADPAVKAVVVNFRDVTERKEAETELAASDARFRTLFEQMTLGIVYQETDGRISLANHAAEEILGLSLDALQGRTSVDPRWQAVREDGSAFPGNEHPAMVALRTGQVVKDVLMGVYHPAKAEWRWIRIDAVPEFRPGAAQPFRVFAIFDDITEQRRIEHAVAESEARYRQAINAAGAIPYSLSYAEKRYDFLPPEAERLIGRMPTEITPEFLAEIWVTSIPRGEFAGLTIEEATARSRRGEGGALWQCDHCLRDIHGELRWFSDDAVQILDEHGIPKGSVGILQDITERKQAEAVLRASEERYRQLATVLEVRVQERTAEVQAERDFARQVMDALGQGLVVSDSRGRAEYVNPMMAQMLDCTPADLIGARLSDFTLPEDLQALNALFPARNSDDEFQFELRMNTATGRVKHMLISSSPRRQDGALAGRIAVFTDLTRLKQIETDLLGSRDELSVVNLNLEKALRLKDEFLASMSHELRTPLTGILGLSEALQMQTYGVLNERQLRAVDTIWQSGQHLLTLINDILDLSKLEAAQFDLELDACDVGEVCRGSLALIKGMAQKKEQHVDFSIDPHFIDLVADPRRVKQMLVNLLSNAVKFTPAHGALGLRVRGDAARQVVELVVWDKGIGIAQADLPRLFQPFVQLDSGLTREYSGTGLGLALVYRMAALHDGSIEVASTPGEGSTFTLMLPWRQPEAAGAVAVRPAPASAPAGAPPASAPTNDGPLLLLAEDNAVSAELLSEFLEVQGYRVTLAKNGLEAVQQAFTLAPALLLMDIQMPLLDGLTAIQQIRACTDPATARVPIIVLTAQAMRGDGERSLAAGADDYLTKPYRFPDVLSAIRKHLQQGAKSS